ncbi:MAG: FAD-dependent thymidylate synthase [Mailhella sp.]|nr:FAD-dependent thymidylate synthase [Mailhella sp.]
MHEVKPRAELVGGHDYVDNIKRIYQGYRRCYSSEEGRIENTSVAEMEQFIMRMLRTEHAHESPLEHVSLTWHVTCSRACSHQLVRHRIASYSQQSQRYVRMDDLPYIMPPAIASNAINRVSFENALEVAENAYRFMTNVGGAGAEDARFILPATVATQLVVTMNFRSLLHFFAERTCNRAQWEIRDIANQMLEKCQAAYPCVFLNVGPHCMKLKHCPEAKPCGKQPWKKES